MENLATDNGISAIQNGIKFPRMNLSNPHKEQDLVWIALIFYLLMSVVGLALILWRHQSFGWPPLAAPDESWPLALGTTIALILGIHLLSRLACAKSPQLRKCGREIVQMLGKLGPVQILAIAIASGIGEELLFRGWLMHETGLWISSLIFGIVHVPPTREWVFWPFFATAMGLLLGWLYHWSGSLVFPIFLHAGINFLNIKMLVEQSTQANHEADTS